MVLTTRLLLVPGCKWVGDIVSPLWLHRHVMVWPLPLQTVVLTRKATIPQARNRYCRFMYIWVNVPIFCVQRHLFESCKGGNWASVTYGCTGPEWNSLHMFHCDNPCKIQPNSAVEHACWHLRVMTSVLMVQWNPFPRQLDHNFRLALDDLVLRNAVQTSHSVAFVWPHWPNLLSDSAGHEIAWLCGTVFTSASPWTLSRVTVLHFIFLICNLI